MLYKSIPKPGKKKKAAKRGRPKKGAPVPYPTLMKKAWDWFSKEIRMRDSDYSGHIRCVSCGLPRRWNGCDAGHFIGREWLSHKFCYTNVHAQCKGCNGPQKGNLIKYRAEIVGRYGEALVRSMEATKNKKKIERFVLEQIIERAKRNIEQYKKEKCI